MANVTLYTLAQEYRADLEKLADLDLSPEVLEDTLEGLGGELATKVQNVVAFAIHLEKLAENMEAAEAEMAKRRKAVKAKSARLKQYALDCMQAAQVQRIDCPWFSLSIAKNPPSVEIEDERQIPAEYLTSPPPPPPKIDKKLIAQAIKDGFTVPGARLKQGVRLAIR